MIDDDPDVRALVRELLTRVEIEVEEAPDRRAGLRVLHQSPPDLVVLDVTMPALDGWDTPERIRDLTDVPVLMLTARTARKTEPPLATAGKERAGFARAR